MQLLTKIALLSLFFLFPCAGQGQLLGLNDNCNPLIKSLNDITYIIRQDFVLEDEKGNGFGKDGNEYFGYTYGPAILLNGQIVFSSRTYTPFLVDTSYKSYGENFKPKVSETYFKGIKEKTLTTANTDNISVDQNHVAIALPDANGISRSNNQMGDSIKCVVITFLPDETNLSDASTFSLSYLYTTVTWKKNIGRLGNNALGSRTVFGLLFYEVIGQGEAYLEFAGFVEKNGKEWICTPFLTLSAMTPLKKNDNGKKNKKKKP